MPLPGFPPRFGKKDPDTTPESLPKLPLPEPGPKDGTVGLLILIRMYVETLRKIEALHPEGVKEGLGKKLSDWDEHNLKDIIETRYQELAALIAEATQKSVSTKQAIQNRMNLRQPPHSIPALFVDDDAVIEVSVESDQVRPEVRWVHEEDYQGIQWQVYLSKDNMAPTDNDRAKFYNFSGLQRKLFCPGEDFRYDETVYVWVRMRVSYSSDEFVSAQWSTTTVAHKPWLRPPKGVQLAMDGSNVVIGLPPVSQPASDWEIALTSPQKKGLADTLYNLPPVSLPDARPGRIVVDVADIGYNIQSHDRTVVARVRQRPWNATKMQPSVFIDSIQELPVISVPLDLTANMSGKNVMLGWTLNAALQVDEYDVRLIYEDTRLEVKSTVAVPPSIDTGKVTTTLKLDSPQEGQALLALVSAKSTTDKPRIALIAQSALTIVFPLEISIDAASNFDTESQILTLVVEGSRMFDKKSKFEIQHVTTAGGNAALFEMIVPSSLYATRAILRTSTPVTSQSSFVIRMTRPSTPAPRVVTTAPWALGNVVTSAEMDLGAFATKWLENSTLELAWEKVVPGVNVAVTVMSESKAYKAHVQPVVGSSVKKMEIQVREDGRSVGSGNKLVCVYVLSMGRCVGVRGRVEVTAP